MKKKVLLILFISSLFGCALHQPYNFIPDEKIADGLTDGVYNGAVDERLDQAEVEVNISENRIADVKIVDVLAFGWRKKAIEESLPPQFITKQSLDIDAVSGATGSTHAVKIAVSKALEKAVPYE